MYTLIKDLYSITFEPLLGDLGGFGKIFHGDIFLILVILSLILSALILPYKSDKKISRKKGGSN